MQLPFHNVAEIDGFGSRTVPNYRKNNKSNGQICHGNHTSRLLPASREMNEIDLASPKQSQPVEKLSVSYREPWEDCRRVYN